MRTFIDGYYAQPATLGVVRAAVRSLEAANAWIAARARVDPQLEGMATTFSSIVLSRRNAFVLHVGDTRIYRLDVDGGLQRLTKDHVAGRGDYAHVFAAPSASRKPRFSIRRPSHSLCMIDFCSARMASTAC